MHAFKFHDTLTPTVTALTVSNLSGHLDFTHDILVLKFIIICGRCHFIKTLLMKILLELIDITGYGPLRCPRCLFTSRKKKSK